MPVPSLGDLLQTVQQALEGTISRGCLCLHGPGRAPRPQLCPGQLGGTQAGGRWRWRAPWSLGALGPRLEDLLQAVDEALQGAVPRRDAHSSCPRGPSLRIPAALATALTAGGGAGLPARGSWAPLLHRPWLVGSFDGKGAPRPPGSGGAAGRAAAGRGGQAKQAHGCIWKAAEQVSKRARVLRHSCLGAHSHPIQAGSPTTLGAAFPEQELGDLLHELHQGAEVQAVLGGSSQGASSLGWLLPVSSTAPGPHSSSRL